MKIRAAADIGINAQHVKFPNTTTQRELLDKVKLHFSNTYELTPPTHYFFSPNS